MMNKILYFLTILVGLILPLQSVEPQIVTRAAFDIGSGKVKMQVAQVELTHNKIQTILFTDFINVFVMENLLKDFGNISESIEKEVIVAIEELKKRAQPFQPSAFYAIATESFRVAKNGPEVAENVSKATGVPLTIVTPEEEGILGFITATSLAKTAPEKTVCWDSGSGSFQVTVQEQGHYYFYLSELGKIPVKNLVLQIQGKNPQEIHSPNPISEEEAEMSIKAIKNTIKDLPIVILNKLMKDDVIVLKIGGHPLGGVPLNFSFSDIVERLKSYLNQDDDTLKNIQIKLQPEPAFRVLAPYAASNLLLAIGVMETLNIRHVHYVGTFSGITTGVLLNSKYWKK